MLKHLQKEKGFYKALFRLAMPVMVQNLLNNSLALVGTFMLGRLGEKEIAAATLANTPFFVVILIIFGFQSGSGVLFSQYWGKKNIKAVNSILGVGILSCAGLTLVISSVCFLSAPQIMALINRDPVIVSLAAQYMRISSFSYVLNAVTLIYIGAQRSIGNPKLGLFILTNTMVIDTILSYIMIFGKFGAPRLGVKGAAYAVLVARIIEFVITLSYALFIQGKLKLDWQRLFRPGKIIARDYLKYSGPVVLNEAVWGLGFSLYSVIFSLMGKSYLAAYTIAGNMDRLLSSVFFGFSIAAGIIIGQLIGAGKEKEARETGITINILSAFIGLLLSAAFIVVAPFVITQFDLPPETLSSVKTFAAVMAVMIAFRSNWVVNAIGTLRAGGDTKFVFIVDVVFMWMLCLPLAAVFGLWLRLPVIWVVLMPALEDALKWFSGLIRFIRGKWLNNITRPDVFTGDEALLDERIITHLEG